MGAKLSEKVQALKALLQDDALVAEILGQTALEQKALDDQGVEFKEVDDGSDPAGDPPGSEDEGGEALALELDLAADEPEDEPAPESDKEVSETPNALEPGAEEASTSEKAKGDKPAVEEDEEEGDESEAVYLADLTVDEFAEMLAGALDEVFGPYFDRMDQMAAAAKPAPSLPAKKEASPEADERDAEIVRLKEQNAKLQEQLDGLPKALKRQAGYIASEDEQTTVKEGDPILEKAPKPDEGITDFISSFVMGKPS